MLEELKKLYVRELNTLKKELLFFLTDEQIWETPEGITNSAGNLILHVCGNLRFFIGNKLGETGYIRDRETEFSSKNLSRAELLAELARTIKEVEESLSRISEESLSENYPIEVGGVILTKKQFLLHLEAHLAFHVGQVGYLRRIVCMDNRSTNPLSVKELDKE
ncbi:MAG: hypothetical protein SCALA702_03970 [Melioribacteraceae bacterium]|nr:MAG: hypothetical protein SCALA702_03970 [Melioribacteraceae bacterium]